jgi:Rab3 GTPase-activating protein regulatory subunit N-terminus
MNAQLQLDCHKLLALASKLEDNAFHFGHPPKPELQMYMFTEIQVSFLVAKTPHYVCSQVVIDADTRNSEPHILLESEGEITASCLVELAAKGSTRRLLILVGCSTSHLYVAAVEVSSTGFTRNAPWQPLPLRPGLLDPKGVTSIVSYDVHNLRYVWISYGDGTLLRIPAEALAQDYAGDVDAGAVLKVQTLLPDSNDGIYNIIPCQACPSMWMISDQHEEYFSALVYPVAATCTGLGDHPTLMVYTSVFVAHEHHESPNDIDNTESELLNAAIGATSTLLRSVTNVVQWGFARKPKPADADSEDEDDHIIIRFPQVYAPATIQLTAAYEIHDSPRQIVSLTISKAYAVITDNLGRVQLLDLENHFQVIRIWKGHREATCVWAGGSIIIYSRQRRSVEVYTLHGKRLLSKQLHRDAEIIQCIESNGNQSCYLLGAVAENRQHVLTELVMDNSIPASILSTIGTPKKRSAQANVDLPSPGFLPTRGAKLQVLQQMLDETHVQCTKEDVLLAFSQITNLQQLSTALDLLCISSAIEERMQANGSDFQEQCVNHCRTVLKEIMEGNVADVTESKHVLDLKSKVALHTQLIDAYRILGQSEKRVSDVSAEDTATNLRSAWIVECMAWLQTYEVVARRSLSFTTMKKSPITFSSFCRGCNIAASTTISKSGMYVIQLSESTKSRMHLLSHLFEPLLKDAFSFTVVNELIDTMGFQAVDCRKYFGHWFMSISAQQAAHNSFFAVQPSITRLVQDFVMKQVDACMDAGQVLPDVLLSELYTLCCQTDDLVRAFLLATVCQESIAVVVKKREVKTHGIVWKTQCVAPWDELLRKVRICLLISLRLHGIPHGQSPITIRNIEDSDVFSVHELVARDELAFTHKHDEIVALESACKHSGLVFNPFTALGDDPRRWKVLQLACMANAISEAERAEYLVELETDVQGALLLYLSHFNMPSTLCAHRALLLAQNWIEEPIRIDILRDCLDALAALVNDAIAAAVRHEIWHTCIRPVFRAFLFGFDHVQEIQEDLFLPMLEDHDWLIRMGKVGHSILALLERAESKLSIAEKTPTEEDARWPPLMRDPVLQRLVNKGCHVNEHALHVHRVVLSGCMISSDVTTLADCVGGFYETFLTLQEPKVVLMGDSDKQMEFLESAIIYRAKTIQKPVLDRFELDEIETLALLWSIDVRDIRTGFLLAMYELGKDTVVDDLLARMSSQRGMDLTRFLEDGIGIVCQRLHQILHVKRNRETRALLGMLDADTTEWIRTAAEHTVSLLDDGLGDRVVLTVPLQLTHVLVLRLLSIASLNADRDTRAKLHSLSILSGTLLKELEGI